MSDDSKNTPKKESGIRIELVKEIKLPAAILAVDAGRDNQHIYAACLDGGIYEVEINSGDRKRIGKHDNYASGVANLSKAETVISSGYDGKLQWHQPIQNTTSRTVQAHKFWSWQMAVSNNDRLVASVTGQYLAGGYKYEPAPEQEPSVQIYDTQSGQLRWSFSHLPPVLSVAFSPDNRFLAAGNMMGEVRIWDLETGNQVASWTTPTFTSWGIIKSHHYIGGIFRLCFSPDSTELLACGMGSMNDPMAGNGKQTWERFAWKENPVRKSGQIHESDNGNGLMETIAFHPSKQFFVMAGRLAQGTWNCGFFSESTGRLIHSADTKMRVVDALFLNEGHQLLLAGASSQEKVKDGKYPEFGRLKLYNCFT